MSEKKLALVLGGGGVRCLAHLGMVEVLREAGIRPDIFVSSSTGSLIACLLAADIAPLDIRNALHTFTQRRLWWRFSFRRGGLFSAEAIRHLLKQFKLPERLEDLPRPAYLLCTDMEKGRQVVAKQGDLVTLVLASAALPGIYAPVQVGSKLLADGGIVNNVPADVARQLVGHEGLVLTSSLELSQEMPAELLQRVPQIVYRSIYLPLLRVRHMTIQLNSDIILQPFSDHPLSFSRWREIVRFYSRSAMADCRQMGRSSMIRHLAELQARLVDAPQTGDTKQSLSASLEKEVAPPAEIEGGNFA
jgi:NTE family protein